MLKCLLGKSTYMCFDQRGPEMLSPSLSPLVNSSTGDCAGQCASLVWRSSDTLVSWDARIVMIVSVRILPNGGHK
jgi:hypothetical protein